MPRGCGRDRDVLQGGDVGLYCVAGVRADTALECEDY